MTEQKRYEMTDTGNAQRVADKFGKVIHYCYKHKRWYFWNGKVWEMDYEGQIKRLTDVIVEDLRREANAATEPDVQKAMFQFAQKSGSSQRKEAMIHETQHIEGIPIMPDDMDRKIDMLNCDNGTVDLRTGSVVPYNSEWLMTMCAGTWCDLSDTEPTLWLKFLDDITCGDKELQHYLQKCVGYSMTGSTQEQCAFFLYGMGNNGKSTFIDTIADVLGTYSANVQPEVFMQQSTVQSSNANSAIARLKGVRFITVEEPTEGVRLNEGLLKQVTGGSKITARFLYGDEFDFYPTFHLWWATNHKPIIRGTDTGIWRRIRLIPFNAAIPPDKVDKTLKYKLRAEYPQILRWAVEGCLMWQKEGLEIPDVVREATEEYKTEMDVLATFCDACLLIDNDKEHTLTVNDLFGLYQAWARGNNEFVMTSRKFSREIKAKLPQAIQTAQQLLYAGVTVTDYGRKYLTSSAPKVEDLR